MRLICLAAGVVGAGAAPAPAATACRMAGAAAEEDLARIEDSYSPCRKERKSPLQSAPAEPEALLTAEDTEGERLPSP